MIRSMIVGTLTLLLPLVASGGTIDFESGFNDLDQIGTVNTGDNQVSFRVGAGAPTNHAVVTRIGGLTTAFQFNDMVNNNAGGLYFLSDEMNGPRATLDYFIQFMATPVISLSLDLFDYRADGGPAVGDVATLTVFSDTLGGTVVGTDTFTVTAGLPDGNVAPLAINNPTGTIRWAHLSFSTGDVGTGIDNIRFQNVPEPASLALLGGGLAFAVARRRRKARGSMAGIQ